MNRSYPLPTVVYPTLWMIPVIILFSNVAEKGTADRLMDKPREPGTRTLASKKSGCTKPCLFSQSLPHV